MDADTGAVRVRQGKGGKSRITFIGAKCWRELLRYLRHRGELPPEAALWTTHEGARLTYSGLRLMVRRRARKAGAPVPSLHAFRRAFALLSLRSGADVYSLQHLLGYADLTVLRRYLAQTTGELQETHARTGPVDHWRP